jgi:hypothetical protein
MTIVMHVTFRNNRRKMIERDSIEAAREAYGEILPKAKRINVVRIGGDKVPRKISL